MKKTKSNAALNEIQNIGNDVYTRIKKKRVPELKMPLRALSNVKYDPKDGFFELLGKIDRKSVV